jgi:putative ABC transport system permease protein
MMVRVALRNVARHRVRTAFTVLALAIAVALLADMLMLSRGMEKTFYRVLSSVGYEVRVCPRGTLPFATDAVIEESGRVTAALRRGGRVDRWLRVLGTTVYADSVPLFVMGVEGERQSLYRVLEGRDLSEPGGRASSSEAARVLSASSPARAHQLGSAMRTDPGEWTARPRGAAPLAATRAERLLLNRNAARALRAAIGDTLTLRHGAGSAATAISPGSIAIVNGIIDVEFDLPGQRTAVMALDAVQSLRGGRDAASFVLVKLAGDGKEAAPPEAQRDVAASLAVALPDLSVYAMDSLMAALQRQLAYFKQFALILSTISLLVTFLLVAVVLTIGVGERRGEIAALRSMGFRRRSIQAMILSESALLLAMSAGAGSVLGWFLAGYLDHILTQSPSLPEGYRFFIPAWREIVLAIVLSGSAGLLAAALPALQAARVDIPRTLHEEVV